MDNKLQSLVFGVPQENFPVSSRVHRLNTLDAYVKRDDELGFGIAGSKIRKYRSLIPKLRQYREIFIIAGPNSNHAVGIIQLLIENELSYRLFLRDGYGSGINGSLIRMMTPDSKITVIARDDWDRALEIVRNLAGPETFVLPEGGSVASSLPGALTLPLDIVKNENGVEFDNILVDAGTGLMAIALILGFAFLGRRTKIHVLLLAGSEKEFSERLRAFHSDFQKMFGTDCPFPKNYCLHYPTNAKSFGSTNQTLFKEIQKIAQEEGFLVDPIYSGKLFYEARKLILKLSGTKLIIHSGGAASLFGFLRPSFIL